MGALGALPCIGPPRSPRTLVSPILASLKVESPRSLSYCPRCSSASGCTCRALLKAPYKPQPSSVQGYL